MEGVMKQSLIWSFTCMVQVSIEMYDITNYSMCLVAIRSLIKKRHGTVVDFGPVAAQSQVSLYHAPHTVFPCLCPIFK